MPAHISSRTPEGAPNHCPVCDALICIEPSQPPGDAPCPNCGVLLWFLPTSAGMRFHETDKAAPIRERIAEILSADLGANRDNVADALSSSSFADLGVDSLDIVEFVMELEEYFDVAIPDQEAEALRTPGDVIDWLLRHKRERGADS